jgi:creatinine amidohydrolase
VLITTATSNDVRERNADVAVLPVGSFEQHGDFLPLATDTLIACAVAERLSTEYGLFLLPPLTITCSHEHADFAGTVSISAQTLAAIVTDILTSLQASGVHRLAVISAHGGNHVLSNVVLQANVAGPRVALFPSRDDWHEARKASGLETSHTEDMHAGELEVSLLLHARPALVRASYRDGDWNADERRLWTTGGIRRYSDSGVIGRPSVATAEKGQRVLESLAESFKYHLDALCTGFKRESPVPQPHGGDGQERRHVAPAEP